MTPETSPKTKEKDEIIDLTKKSHMTVTAPPKPKRDWSSLVPDYANVEMEPRATEKSIKTTESNSEFLDQQMAKLMARRGQDDTDGASMPRSKSGDNISQASTMKRNSEILDDDAKKMLRDCQEYLLGASFESRTKDRSVSTETSPRGSLHKMGGRSVHSSPGNSYNKYSGGQRSSGGGGGVELPPHSEHSSLQSQYSVSPHSETGPSSLETEVRGGPEYENVCNNSYNEARGKLSAAVRVRNRERRNSFRQAVDRVDSNGRPYEQIWFQGGDGEEAAYHGLTGRGNSGGPTETPIYVNMTSRSSEQKQMRKSDSGSTRSGSGHIRSGSYDNIPTPGPNTSQAIFTLDPNPTAYEIINFSPSRGDGRKQSSESQNSGLQSVGLVTEALREHERSSQPGPNHHQILSKQNSLGNLRAPPPPYQAPPGPPPAYSQLVSPPKHKSPSYHHPSPGQVGPDSDCLQSLINLLPAQVDPAPSQAPSQSTPKRSSAPGSARPSQPLGNNVEMNRSRPGTATQQTQSSKSRKLIVCLFICFFVVVLSSPNTCRAILTILSLPAGDIRARGSRSRDDTELSARNNRNMRRNHSLDPRSSRLSLGDFVTNSPGQIVPGFSGGLLSFMLKCWWYNKTNYRSSLQAREAREDGARRCCPWECRPGPEDGGYDGSRLRPRR